MRKDQKQNDRQCHHALHFLSNKSPATEMSRRNDIGCWTKYRDVCVCVHVHPNKTIPWLLRFPLINVQSHLSQFISDLQGLMLRLYHCLKTSRTDTVKELWLRRIMYHTKWATVESTRSSKGCKWRIHFSLRKGHQISNWSENNELSERHCGLAAITNLCPYRQLRVVTCNLLSCQMYCVL